jgi:hypothetical protein
MTAGNNPKNSQIRVLSRSVLESTPLSVKIPMFVEVGGIVGRTRFVLALDAIGEFVIVGGSVNRLLGATVVVPPVLCIPAEVKSVVQGLREPEAVPVGVTLMILKPAWLVKLMTPEPARPSN